MAKHPEHLWRDPFKASPSGAVLLSDQIHFLADEIGLIDPFEEELLRPAAYDLRVGNCYYVDDVRIDLTKESNIIEIPPNGLVYVRTLEKFNIPYYLIARYSLRVHQVYRGLLIDNGLHIDPGYCGHIWIPVHNFTMQTRVLAHGHEFISVEFNHTTPLPDAVKTITTQDDLVSRGIRKELHGSNGYPIKVFYKDLKRYEKRNEEFTPRLFWDKFPGEKHQSAMLGTDQRIDKLREDVQQHVDRLQKIGWFTLVGLVLGLLAILLPILYAEYGKSREAAAQQGAEIRDLRERLQEQKARLDAIPPSQPPTNPKPATKSGR